MVPRKRNFYSGARQMFPESRMCLQTIHYIYATKGGYRVYNTFSISTLSRKKKIGSCPISSLVHLGRSPGIQLCLSASRI